MTFTIKYRTMPLCRFLSFFVIALWLTVICSAERSYSANQGNYWPTDEWKTSAPEEQSVDSDILYDVDDDIQRRFPDIYSFLVIKNGRLVFEKYYSPGDREMIAPVHSVTKSVMSLLIGIAIDQGKITSIDQKVSDFFPELFSGDINPAKKNISIKHLLTMTPGFEWGDRSEIFWEWFFSSDFIKFTFNLELATPPGEKFVYSTAVSHVLSGILTRATGMTALEFAQKYLFGPLGIEDVKWSDGPKGFSRGGTGLQLKARDMAKIGFLYLNNGIWENKSIVSKTWVKDSTSFQVDADFGYGYGYQWWIRNINGCRSYRAWGRGGQFIVVVPDLDIVMVVTSKFDLPRPPTQHYSPLFDHIAEAVTGKECSLDNKDYNISEVDIEAGDLDRCKHLVNVPEGVVTFLDGYAKAFKEQDIEKSMTYYSDSFLLGNRDKEGSRKMLSALYSQIPINSMCIQLNQFKQNGSIADIAGTLHLNSRSTKLIVPQIIKENGQWKWYGEHRNTADSQPSVPQEISQLLAGYSSAIVSHEKTKMANYFSDNFSSRGFTKDSFISYVVPIYTDISSVEIEITDYERKENSVYAEGLFKTKPYGVTPLMFNTIILEDGIWKWAGTTNPPKL